MKNLLIIFLILITSIKSYSQWDYGSGGNDFDGKYTYAFVDGTGGEFPYDEPRMALDFFKEIECLNIYIKGAGSYLCDDNYIKIKFSGEDQIRTLKGNEIWIDEEGDTIFLYMKGLEDFINKLKANSYVGMRIGNDCGQRDYRFSLSGSSKALNYAVGDYFSLGIIDSRYNH